MIDPTSIGFIGWPEALAIVAVIVLLFGATRLPQIGRGLGEGIREFKKSLTGGGGDEDDERPGIEGEGGDGKEDR